MRHHLPYMPGIDALRTIAVLAVFFYHADTGGWLPGGFLGVDVFFVVSGYLITALLLSEFRLTGHLDVLRFWAGRARRLLPAVGAMVAVTLVVPRSWPARSWPPCAAMRSPRSST